MTLAQGRRVTYNRPVSELVFSPWVLLPISVLLGAFVAYQFFHLTARYVKLLFALVVLLSLLRLSFTGSTALFLVLWTAPTSIFLGDTNVIFIGTMTVLWLVRMRLGLVPRPVRTPIDWAVWVYLGLHFLSFINIESELVLQGSTESMKFMVAGVLFYILIVNALRTEAELHLALRAMTVAALFVDVTALADHYFGVRLIPAWFLFAPATLRQVEQAGRAQGVFGFHGLLADFSAMSFYIQVVLGMRARGRARKLFYYGMAAISVHMIAITANRGGALIWVLGGLLFLWYYRHRIRWAVVALFTPVIAALIATAGLFSDQVLYRIRVVARLAQTQLSRGIPENRLAVWSNVVSRIPEHPWIGHGPFIDLRRGVSREMFWPHNAYLFYLFTSGVLGLLSWLWILGKMLWTSAPRGTVDFARDRLARAVQAAFFIQIVMFAFSQLRDEHQRGNVYYYYMWILFALATVASRLVRAQRVENRQAAGEQPGGTAAAEATAPFPDSA